MIFFNNIQQFEYKSKGQVKQRAAVCFFMLCLDARTGQNRPGRGPQNRARGRGAIARCRCALWRRCVQERLEAPKKALKRLEKASKTLNKRGPQDLPWPAMKVRFFSTEIDGFGHPGPPGMLNYEAGPPQARTGQDGGSQNRARGRGTIARCRCAL